MNIKINKRKDMSFTFNPFEMGEEATSSTPIPTFTKGDFMLVKLAPPKTKGVRDGLVATLAMLNYIDPATNKAIPMVEVKQSITGYTVELPHGKGGILCTKFRGPKNWYTFRNDITLKKYIIGKNDPITKINSRCTVEAAEAVLSTRIPDWDVLDQTSKDFHIDKYYEDFYMYGLAKDFNLNVETDETALPTIGMITEMYREYTPPVGDEKYGRIVITKFAPKHKVTNLSGEIRLSNTEIAAAIYEGLTTVQRLPSLPEFPTLENSDDEAPF